VHPQLFLRTYWRMELRPQVFVAMSLAECYQSRFDDVIAPAIRSASIDGANLEPYRVDLSKTGDSILTDIMDGIAHSQLVLADVSSCGNDPATRKAHRNCNVMYEVGLALACRQPSEVLLIRDDRDEFLFDVSTIPHMTLDFCDKETAIAKLSDALRARIEERRHEDDLRVRLGLATLTHQEAVALAYFAGYGKPWSTGYSESVFVPRLLDKGLLTWVGRFGEKETYRPTPLGYVVARLSLQEMPIPREE